MMQQPLIPANGHDRKQIFWSTANLLNNIVGAGFLGLPHCRALLGPQAALFYTMLACIATLNWIGFWLLGQAAEQVRQNGEDVALAGIYHRALAENWPLRVLSRLANIGYPICSLISYATVTKDLLQHLRLPRQLPLPPQEVLWVLLALMVLAAFVTLWKSDGRCSPTLGLCIAAFALAVVSQRSGENPPMGAISAAAAVFLFLPLSCQRRIESLGWASAVAVLLATIIVLYLAYLALFSADDGSKGEAKPDSSRSLLDGLDLGFQVGSVMLVSFTAHYNAPQYYRELGPGDQRAAFTRVITFSVVAAFILYSTSAFLGYSLWGAQVPGDLIQVLPHNSLSLFYIYVLVADFPKVALGVREQTLLQQNNETAPLTVLLGRTFVLVVLVVIVGFRAQLQEILALKGLLFGSMLVYCLPAYAFLRLRGAERRLWELCICCLMIALGLAGFAVGLLRFMLQFR